jgi:hypothetical protein
LTYFLLLSIFLPRFIYLPFLVQIIYFFLFIFIFFPTYPFTHVSLPFIYSSVPYLHQVQYISIFQSTDPSINISIQLFCFTIHGSVHPSISSICHPIHRSTQFIIQSTDSSIHISIQFLCLTIHGSVHSSIPITGQNKVNTMQTYRVTRSTLKQGHFISLHPHNGGSFPGGKAAGACS